MLHRVSDGLAHAAHDAFPTLVEHEFNDRPTVISRLDRGSVGNRKAIAEFDSAGQGTCRSRRDRPPNLCHVRLLNPVRRMHQPMRKISVIREQQQPFGVFIEPADMEEPLREPTDEVANAWTSLVVCHGGDNSSGLVQHVDDMFLSEAHRTAIDRHTIVRGINSRAEVSDLAVDPYAPVPHERVAGTTGAKPRLSEEFLQANAVVLHNGTVDLYFTVRRLDP